MAVSRRKLEANRRNAVSSTGPLSAAGKAASRLNATTHGLSSQRSATDGTVSEMLAFLKNGFAASAQSMIVAEESARLARIFLLRAETLDRGILGHLKQSTGGVAEFSPGSLDETLAMLLKLDRYERRSLSRRRKAIRTLSAVEE